MRLVPTLAALGVGLLAAAAPAPSGAATFAATSVEEVARTSDAVFRGRVVGTAARATRDGRIVTEVEVAVGAAWKGAAEPTVRVVVPGGRLPRVAMRVDAAPTFAAGEEVVVFVVRRGRAWHVNGLALGKFGVVGGEAHPSLRGAAVLPRALPAGEKQVGAMPVAELERRVKAAR